MKKDYPMIDIRSRLIITEVQQRKTFVALSNLKDAKKHMIIVHAGTSQTTPNQNKRYYKSKLPNCKYAISNAIIKKYKPDIEKVIDCNKTLKILQQK